MTAVASPPSFQPLSRDGYVNGSLNTMSQEDLSRSFLPRKSVQRTGSSSSLSSNASSTSAVSSSTTTPANGVHNNDGAAGARKKPTRGIWPPSKSEPVSGISITRSQSVPPAPTANGVASLSSLAPSPLPAQQPMSQAHAQPNGLSRPEATAILHLTPINGTFERKTITVPYHPDIIRIGRQTNQKTVPTPSNGYFDSKVLSRQHAEIWADREGKIWIRDVKSSNGTFVNQRRLSLENKDSDPCMLKEQDILELGIDIVSEDQKSVVHHKVAARVEHAGVYPLTSNALDITFGDLDQATGGAGIGQQLTHNIRGRSPNQASVAPSQRYSNPNVGVAGNLAASSYQTKWLQPITMEHVVKKLNTELKQARLQSQDLHHTGSYVDALLNREVPPPPPPTTSASSSLPRKQSSPTKLSDIKARFASEPPAPPPSQPLPEKPDIANRANLPEFPNLQPLLRRSDTEKPKLSSESNSTGNSPVKSDPSHQILNLIEALTRAQNEIDSQSDRIKQMENLLQNEREARTNAEERAVRLESGGSALTPDALSQTRDFTTDVQSRDGSTAQQRLELMQREMNEMKLEMDKYRSRAEEAEEESKKNRQSLEEMVESITRRSAAAKQRKAAKRAAARAAQANKESSTSTKDSATTVGGANSEDDFDEDDTLDLDGLSEDLNGHVDPAIIQKLKRSSTIRPHDHNPALAEARLKQLQSAVNNLQGKGGVLRQEHLAHTAPLASLLGVVLLGVGMMAYLNGWQKVSER